MQTSCCKYDLVQKHKGDDCRTFDIYDPNDDANSDWPAPSWPGSPNNNPLLPNGPNNKPQGPGSPSNPNPRNGGGGPPKPPVVGPGGKPGTGSDPKHSPIHHAMDDEFTLSLYEAEFMPDPNEVIKSFQRIQYDFFLSPFSKNYFTSV